MFRTQLLVPGSDLMAAPPSRHRTKSRRLRSSDPAVRAMTDFLRDPPLTTVEDCDLDTAMDDMFRLGVRAFLVVRDLAVVGLITAEDLRRHMARLGFRSIDEMVGRAAAAAAARTEAVLIEYPVWMWHWATPGDPAVPWNRARRVELTDDALNVKAIAAESFSSQTRPTPDREAVLPPAVLQRLLAIGEVVFV